MELLQAGAWICCQGHESAERSEGTLYNRSRGAIRSVIYTDLIQAPLTLNPWFSWTDCLKFLIWSSPEFWSDYPRTKRHKFPIPKSPVHSPGPIHTPLYEIRSNVRKNWIWSSRKQTSPAGSDSDLLKTGSYSLTDDYEKENNPRGGVLGDEQRVPQDQNWHESGLLFRPSRDLLALPTGDGNEPNPFLGLNPEGRRYPG